MTNKVKFNDRNLSYDLYIFFLMLFVIMRDREILHEQLGLEKVYNSPDQVLMAKLQRETTISDGPVH